MGRAQMPDTVRVPPTLLSRCVWSLYDIKSPSSIAGMFGRATTSYSHFRGGGDRSLNEEGATSLRIPSTNSTIYVVGGV